MTVSEKALFILDTLSGIYGVTKPQLDFNNPFELLIATILSAQCTDRRVNIVTKELFAKYKTPQDYIDADISDLEKMIFSTGFYRNKAKNIKNCCSVLLEKYKGTVPADVDKIAELPGAGRKTASVVAGNAFNIPAIAVDTHVMRITNLLGLVNSKNPEIIERELKLIFPEKYWVQSTHLFIALGREICIARRPKCEVCPLKSICPSSL